MKAISLKVKEEVFYKAEEIRKQKDVSRNAYINEAIQCYNVKLEKEYLEKVLKKESILVRETSMESLKEFEEIED